MIRPLRIQQFAALAGVTVRTLHHYDRVGLLRPRRTPSGYRSYSPADLDRLERIAALKFLGLPLKRIRELLDRDSHALPEALHAQRRALEHKRRLLTQAIRAIRRAEASLAHDQAPVPAVLKKLIEVIQMQDNTDFLNQYYGPEAQAKLAQRRRDWTPELQQKTTDAWTALFREIEATLDQDPASPAAQALAARWQALIAEFTQGDPALSAGLNKAVAARGQWPASLQREAQPFANPRVWAFIRKAIDARRS